MENWWPCQVDGTEPWFRWVLSELSTLGTYASTERMLSSQPLQQQYEQTCCTVVQYAAVHLEGAEGPPSQLLHPKAMLWC